MPSLVKYPDSYQTCQLIFPFWPSKCLNFLSFVFLNHNSQYTHYKIVTLKNSQLLFYVVIKCRMQYVFLPKKNPCRIWKCSKMLYSLLLPYICMIWEIQFFILTQKPFKGSNPSPQNCPSNTFVEVTHSNLMLTF